MNLIADRGVTAWVAANDEVGVACLRLLRDRRVDVPGQVSVAAFDDTFLALVNDLTSYDFAADAVTGAMVNSLVAPSWPPLQREPATLVEIAGFVNERGSTGQARRTAP